MRKRSAAWLATAAFAGLAFPTGALADRIVQEWACLALGQYGLEVPSEGEGRSILRDAKVPVRITLRESTSRAGHTVEMKFIGQPYLAGFGHAFVADSGSAVAFTSQVVRAVSTSSPSGPKVLILERDGARWRFLTQTTTLVTAQYAGQLSQRLGGAVNVKPQSSSLMFAGECNATDRVAEQDAPARSAAPAKGRAAQAASSRMRTAFATTEDADPAQDMADVAPAPANGVAAQPSPLPKR